ncbi:hypothetical protein JCM3770_003605 [Rhodotorula araucariae]
MSTYGTPFHPSQRPHRPTQPPATGPSLLSTPLRTPTALRPSLFHPRGSPLSLSLSRSEPRTSVHLTPATATPRLAAPANTPASAQRAGALAGSNPFDALPAAAFDTFVSGLTSSIRAVLEPRARGELPLERRRREREERQRERDEAQRERERVRVEREERRAAEEARAKREEEDRRDVFGEVRGVDGADDDLVEDDISAADFARPGSPQTGHSAVADLSTQTPPRRTSPGQHFAPSSSSPHETARPEMREARLASARPLFAPRSGASASASEREDEREEDGDGREATYGLDSAASSSVDEGNREREVARVWDEESVGEGVEDSDRAAEKDGALDLSAPEGEAEAYAYGFAPASSEEEEGAATPGEDASAGEYYSAGDDAPIPGALVDYDGGSAMDSAEAEWAGRGLSPREGEGEETRRTKGGTELLELGSSSDDGDAVPAPRPPPHRAIHAAPLQERDEEAREQPRHVSAPGSAYDSDKLAVLPPWIAGAHALDEGDEDGGASSAAYADVEDEGEESAVEEGQPGEWYGEGLPRDDGRVWREEEEDEHMGARPHDGGAKNPLELLYADEDSEDVRPRIPYEAKGKARAPPTPSDPSYAGDDTARSSLSPTPSELDVDEAIAHWSAHGATALRDLEPADLLQTHDRLVADLQRAVEGDSDVARLLVRQMEDVEAEFSRQTGLSIVLDDEEDDDENSEVGEYEPQDFALSDDDRGAGETYALPGSPLSSRSASPAPPADDDDAIRTASPDRSAYFPDLDAADRDEGEGESPAAEARLAEIAGELVQLREAGVQGGVRVIPGQEEEEEQEDEDEQMLVIEETVTQVVETFVQQLGVRGRLDEAPAPLDDGTSFVEGRDADLLMTDEGAQSTKVDLAQPSGRGVEPVGYKAPESIAVEHQDDLQVEASPHASYAPSAPVDPLFDAPLAPSAGESASTGDPHASRATLSAPHLSSHFRFQAAPTPALDSPVPYPPVHAEHSVNSPVHSDDDLAEGETPQDEEAPIRVGVADEEMQDGALVGRLLPLSRLEDGSPTRAREARDVDTPDATEGGLVIVDDDAALPPSRAPEPEDFAMQAFEPDAQPHERDRLVIGATPPPEQRDDDELPPIVEGVAPPQNLDIVPAPMPSTPPPADPVAQTVEPVVLASPAAASTPPLASFAPSARIDPVFDAPLGPSWEDAASAGDPHASLAPLSAPHLSSHFRFETGPTPALDSPVPYPPVHAEHNFDSPVHEGDLTRGEEEAPVRVGVDAEEMRDEALVGRARPLEGAEDATGTHVCEQEDVETDSAVGGGGLVVIDDDADLAPVLEDNTQESADVKTAPGLEHVVLTATPPPIDTSVEVSQPPIVDGVAPPQNPALLPSARPATPLAAAALTNANASPGAPAPYPPFAPVEPVLNPGFIPSTYTSEDDSGPSAPSSALSPSHLSSHFQISAARVPTVDSRVPYTSRGEEEAPLRVGVEAEELRVDALVGRARPLEGAEDSTRTHMHEQEDVETGRAGDAGGLVVIDDDADLAPSGEENVRIAQETVDVNSKTEPERIVLGATPPPGAPVVNGVAPPQNLELIPAPAPPSPPAPNNEALPAPSADLAAASDAVAAPHPADEIRFEDLVALDSSTDEDGDDSADEVLSTLVPNRSRHTSQASRPPLTVLRLPAGEDVSTAGAAVQPAEDDDEQESPSIIKGYVRPLGLETVTETSTEAAEVGEEDELVSSDRDETGTAAHEGSSMAPSSEPISYRSEDERDGFASDGESEQDVLSGDNGREVVFNEPTAPHPPLHIHDVVEPGEWDPSEPIRFGESSGATVREPAEEPVVEEPVEQDDVVRGGSAAVEVDTDAEAMQPSEVLSARGASVLSERSADLDAQAADSSPAAQIVDEKARLASQAARISLEVQAGRASTSSDNDGDEIRVAPLSPRPPSYPPTVEEIVEDTNARESSRRTPSVGKADDEPPPAERDSPARRSGRLSAIPNSLSSSSAKPDTPAARKRVRKSEATESAGSAFSPTKRVKRSVLTKSQRGGTSSATDSDDEPAERTSAPAVRVHHHHHHASSSTSGPSTRTRSSGAPRASEAPLTRSHCDIVTLKLRSHEAPRGPASVYVVRVPACALTAPVAQETMRVFGVENLGPVDATEHCEGVTLGGKSVAAESLHEALIPHGDVLTAVRRIVGPELWDEGVAEVLPQGERERAIARGTPIGKGKKRMADSQPEDGGSAKGKRSK